MKRSTKKTKLLYIIEIERTFHSHFPCVTTCFKEPSHCLIHVIFPLLNSHVLPYCIRETSEDIISFNHRCELDQLLLKFTESGIFIRPSLPDL